MQPKGPSLESRWSVSGFASVGRGSNEYRCAGRKRPERPLEEPCEVRRDTPTDMGMQLDAALEPTAASHGRPRYGTTPGSLTMSRARTAPVGRVNASSFRDIPTTRYVASGG